MFKVILLFLWFLSFIAFTFQINQHFQEWPIPPWWLSILLKGFAHTWELRFVRSMLHLVMLLGHPVRKSLITATTTHQNLHTLMHFFRNLSISDMSYISVTVSNVCVNSLTMESFPAVISSNSTFGVSHLKNPVNHTHLLQTEGTLLNLSLG